MSCPFDCKNITEVKNFWQNKLVEIQLTLSACISQIPIIFKFNPWYF